MKLKYLILLFFPLLFLTSCFDVIGPWNKWEDGKYYVVESYSGTDNLMLYIEAGGGCGHGRVNNVKQIGANKNFIIVKSSNDDLFYEYWILDKRKDNHFLNSDEIMYGPFTETEFEEKKKSIGLLNIEFDNKFE